MHEQDYRRSPSVPVAAKGGTLKPGPPEPERNDPPGPPLTGTANERNLRAAAAMAHWADPPLGLFGTLDTNRGGLGAAISGVEGRVDGKPRSLRQADVTDGQFGAPLKRATKQELGPHDKPDPTRDSVQHYVALVRKMERALPGWSGEQVANNLRVLGGVDDGLFQKMYGMDDLDKKDWNHRYGIDAVGGSKKDKAWQQKYGDSYRDLTAPQRQTALRELLQTHGMKKADVDALMRMSNHSDESHGFARDSFGQDVAMGHVLTGISGGMYRNKDTELRPGWAQSLRLGFPLDNLYATTLAGDLGQSLAKGGHEGRFLGPGTEASNPELVGDIDGMLLGSHQQLLSKGKSLQTNGPTGVKLSQMLSTYYDPRNQNKVTIDQTDLRPGVLPPEVTHRPVDAAHRFTSFYDDLSEKDNFKTLQEQSYKFYIDYAAKTDPTSVFSTRDQFNPMIDEFNQYLDQNALNEEKRNDKKTDAKFKQLEELKKRDPQAAERQAQQLLRFSQEGVP